MKKTILVFALLFATSSLVASANDYNLELKYGIKKYKTGNYLSCIQHMKDIIEEDPSNALAHYYLAISNARIGNKSEAISEYTTVKRIDSSFLLSLYADKGIKCLKKPNQCEGVFLNEDMDEDYSVKINSTDSKTSKELEKKQKLRKIKQLLNEDKEVPNADMKLFKDLTPKRRSSADMPSDAEIANAVKTLAKAGVNPMMMGSNPMMNSMNSQNMQMQMLMSSLNPNQNNNNNSYNSMNSMMPLMMMSQGEKANPEFVQSMMTNMLMPDFSSFGNTSNN